MARKRRQRVELPNSARLTTMLFPPYGLAWLWTRKDLDRETKIYGSIGLCFYLVMWLVLVFLILYIAFVMPTVL